MVASLLAALGSSSAALGDETCTNRFTEPSTGHITVDPDFGVVTGTTMSLQVLPDGNNDAMIWDSVVFHIAGPSGAVDVKTSNDSGGGAYKPTAEGHYTVAATWTRYDCGDPGRQTTTTGSAPAVPFDVVHGQRPGARFSTTKRPRRNLGQGHIQPGDATLTVIAACPRDEVATHEPLTIDIYWTTSGHPATHSSRHVRSRGTTGCYSTKSTRTKDFNSERLNASASGETAFIDVYEPLRADVLVEVRSGTVVVGARRAKFRRSRTGQGVKVGPA
jgi:hypothetical protein